MAHIMTYEELRSVPLRHTVYEEIKHVKYKVYPLKYNGIDFTDGVHYLLMCECNEEECMDYNWNYRVWNEMPTIEEMNNTPWKDDPYV